MAFNFVKLKNVISISGFSLSSQITNKFEHLYSCFVPSWFASEIYLLCDLAGAHFSSLGPDLILLICLSFFMVKISSYQIFFSIKDQIVNILSFMCYVGSLLLCGEKAAIDSMQFYKIMVSHTNDVWLGFCDVWYNVCHSHLVHNTKLETFASISSLVRCNQN